MARGARTGRLALLFLAHAVGTANITLIVAMAPAVERMLALTHADFGLLIAAYYCAMTIWALPGGWFVDRFGIRPVLIAAHVLLALGMLVVARASGLIDCAAGLALCGSGYALVNPATARGVLLWFPQRGRGTAMGIKQTGVPAGGVAAALVATAAGDAWRELAFAFAVLTIATGLGFSMLRMPGAMGGSANRFRDMTLLFARWRLASFNAAAFLYSGMQTVLFAYFVLYAHEVLAVDMAMAGFCLALAHAASAAGRIGWGVFSDLLPRDGRTISLIACGVLGAVSVALLGVIADLGAVSLLPVLVLILGFTLGGNAPLLQAAAVESVEPRFAGASVGYNMLAITAGSMVAPAIFGAALGYAGYTQAWIAVAIVLLLAAALTCIGLKRRENG